MSMVGAVAARRRVVTVSELSPLIAVPHRGGAYMSKDNALSAYAYLGSLLPRSRYVLDADVQALSDGTLVLMHDATVDRTTDGTGNISAKTLAQFQALKLRDFPYTKGTISTETPPTFAQYLDMVYAYGAVGIAECKVTSGTTVAAAMVAAIVARGMQKQIIFASVDAAACTIAKAAGMATMLVQDATHVLTAATMATSVNGGPPDHVCYDYSDTTNFSNAWLSSLVAAGIVNLWPYTILGRRTILAAEQTRVTGLGGTFAGYFASDALYASARNPLKLATDAVIDTYDHGMLQSFYSTGTATSCEAAKRAYPSAGRMLLDSASTNGQAIMLGAMAGVSAPSKIEWTWVFDTLSPASASTRLASLIVGMTTDAPVALSQALNVRGQGYFAYIRESGALGLSTANRPAGGGGATTLTTGTSPAITTGQQVPMRFEFLGNGTLRLTRVDTGDAITSVADTTYRGPYFAFAKSGGDAAYSFKDVVVTP